jgi:hypothetical protein
VSEYATRDDMMNRKWLGILQKAMKIRKTGKTAPGKKGSTSLF